MLKEIPEAGLSTGVLSDMQQFFDNLRTNLDSLETLPPEERDALMGKSAPPPGMRIFYNRL
ncbi:hypothetical protein J6590_078549 [Homalodisca vitripennis]|nr:hypothetical protein J6590_078549 [Homalodisca vitripennis]